MLYWSNKQISVPIFTAEVKAMSIHEQIKCMVKTIVEIVKNPITIDMMSMTFNLN